MKTFTLSFELCCFKKFFVLDVTPFYWIKPSMFISSVTYREDETIHLYVGPFLLTILEWEQFFELSFRIQPDNYKWNPHEDELSKTARKIF